MNETDESENGTQRFAVTRFFLDEYAPHSYVMLACAVALPIVTGSVAAESVRAGSSVVSALVTFGAVWGFEAFFLGVAWSSMYDEAHGGDGDAA